MREMLTLTLTHQAGINAELSEPPLSSDSYHNYRGSESVNQHSEASLHTGIMCHIAASQSAEEIQLLRQLRV